MLKVTGCLAVACLKCVSRDRIMAGISPPSRTTASEPLVMSADDILLDVEDRMEKAIGILKNNLSGIRTGRANPGLVDSLKVEIYGSQTPMKQLANVGAPEPQQLVIRPHDPGTIQEIEKAIIGSG